MGQRRTVWSLKDVDPVGEEKRLQPIKVLMDLGELSELGVVERLEADIGFGRFLLGHFDIAERLAQAQNLRNFVRSELCAKAGLLVLLLEALDRSQLLSAPHRHSAE